MATMIDAGLLPLTGAGETVLVDGTAVANVLVSPGGVQDDEVDNDALRIVGRPVRYADALTPGDWDMPAYAMAMSADLSVTVKVVAISATVDALGDPVTVETLVYEGPAQARNHAGSESAGEVEEQRPRETWWFVVPWQAAFAALRPQSTAVEYGGARYDVVRVVNVAERSEAASFEAVRHG